MTKQSKEEIARIQKMRYVDTQQIKAALEISGYKMSSEMVRYYLKSHGIEPVAKVGNFKLYLDATIEYLIDYLNDKKASHDRRR